MPQLIKQGAVVEDRWTLLREAVSMNDIAVKGPVIVPLALWQADRAPLAGRGEVGVWLKPSDDPAELAGDVDRLPLIAVDFPQFTDGRGYSSARLLREKYRFTGELRAIGEVLRDQLSYMRACGFDAYSIRADRDAADALKGFADFSDAYQSNVSEPRPLFRRHARPASGDTAKPAGGAL